MILPGPSMHTDPDYSWTNDPLNPSIRVVDALNREWATTRNGTWGAIGHDVTCDNYTQLEARFGPVERWQA